MDNKILTVSIPTYNRPEQLKRTLELLLPQLTEQCFLRILDNHSIIPVKEYTESIIGHFPNVKYEIVRNKINVGADNNIMRCFEYCDTDWLWTLGDDDIIESNAIAIIFEDINDYKEAFNINYYSPSINHPIRKKISLGFGIKGNIENMDSFGASIFISSNVYNYKLIKTRTDLSLAYHYTYSCASQWFILYSSLLNDGLTVSSPKIICKNGVDSFLSYRTHSTVNLSIAKGFASILELLTEKKFKRLLINKLKTTSSNWITFDSIVKTLIIEYRKDSTKDIKFALKQHYTHYYQYFGLKITLKFLLIYSLLFLSPAIAYKLIRLMYLKKRNIDLNIFIN